MIWIPAKQAKIEPAEATIRRYSIPGLGDIAIPVLSSTNPPGEEARIANFVNREQDIYRYYSEILYGKERISNRYEEILHDASIPRRGLSLSHIPAAAIPRRVIPRRESITEIESSVTITGYQNADSNRDFSPNQFQYMVSSLMTRLERIGLGVLQSTGDVALSMRHTHFRASVLLIRPLTKGLRFQLCFVVGSKKWRRRRSMDANLVRITFADSDTVRTQSGNAVDISCNCIEYTTTGNCEHCKATYGSEENWMRIMALSVQDIHPAETGGSDSWEGVRYPGFPKDTVELWHVFNRGKVSSMFQTSATVLLDIRAARLSKRLKERIQCTVCPGVAKNRMLCIHETMALGIMAIQNNENDSEVAETRTHRDEDYWSTVLGEEDSELDETMTTEPATAIENSGDALLVPQLPAEVTYTSQRPRFFFPCRSDDSALQKFLMSVSAAKTANTNEIFLAIDEEAICPSCGLDAKQSEEDNCRIRSASVYTLHHGAIDIKVTDFICLNCRRCIPFDGYSDAFFCLTKKHIFTRELLDAWLWDLCGSGGTFRDVFSSWSSQGLAESASIHRIGREMDINRQRGNEAFSAFLKTLRFPKDEDLYSLFSCTKCERDPSSGTRELDAVVMDGTALGILGSLPKFNRQTRTVKAAPRMPDKQYIMRKPKLRGFVDAVLTSAKAGDGLDDFNVALKLPLWRKKDELLSLLFDYSAGIQSPSFLIAKFMNAGFLDITNTANDNGEEGESDEDYSLGARCLRFRHKLSSIDVRRTMIEFGRCFAVASIPGGALRNAESVPQASILEKELRRFSDCKHLTIPGGAYNSDICQPCAQRLLGISRRVDEKVTSGARLSCALANAAILHDCSQLRNLASVASEIIQEAIRIREYYFQLFQSNQGEDLMYYNATHRNGTGLDELPDEDWLTEAQ